VSCLFGLFQENFGVDLAKLNFTGLVMLGQYIEHHLDKA